MAPVVIDVIRTTDPMVILRERGNQSRNLLIRGAAYDTVQQRTILPIQEIKADEMEMRKRRMVRIPNREREEEGRRMKPDSSLGIYVTESVEAQRRMIPAEESGFILLPSSSLSLFGIFTILLFLISISSAFIS